MKILFGSSKSSKSPDAKTNSSPLLRLMSKSILVQAQKTTRLCIVRDLTEHDIVSRIMRKDNYLIGMLNRGVLALHISLPGVRPKFMLTKTLEWNLQWCILDAMFDDSFRIRPDFVNNPRAIERRFRYISGHLFKVANFKKLPLA